jgi:predicted nucleotidyltransferase
MTTLEGVRDASIRRLGDDLARGLRAEPTVRLAWLFGSRVRGTARAESDVDVAVLVDDACAAGSGALKDSCFRLIPLMTRAVRSDLIDLVILNHAPPLLRHRVIRDGVLLYARADAERVRFVHDTLREYLDFEPRLREQTRLLIRRMKEGRPRHDGRYRNLLEAARRAGRLSAAAAEPRRSQ